MKISVWLPAVIALGIEAIIVSIALFAVGPHNVVVHSMGVLVLTLDLLFLAYSLHFVGQQDFIAGGCRPYAMNVIGPSGFLFMMALICMCGLSFMSCVISGFELFQNALLVSPDWWPIMIGCHIGFYTVLLSLSRLKAKEDETIYVNGKLLKQGEAVFIWPWSYEQYNICRHWPERPAPADALHQNC